MKAVLDDSVIFLELCPVTFACRFRGFVLPSYNIDANFPNAVTIITVGRGEYQSVKGNEI